MSTSLFDITEHDIPCQHIRHYHDALKNEKDVLRLNIKEYRPLNNFNAEADSVTIIAAHGNGFPKETYEALWDDLLRASNGFKIRAIWIADVSNQGKSGVQNENIQGDDPSWFDHSRDLLGMVNHFRERIHRPIIGIGHSMGATQLVQLSIIHPRLFSGLALIEPIIQASPPSGPNAAMFSSYRKDLWSSRSEAEAAIRKSGFFKAWDPRVLDTYLQYSLRSIPTAVYPDDRSRDPAIALTNAVTLTISKHQEAWSYVRPNFTPQSNEPNVDPVERLLSPDITPVTEGKYRFASPEALLTYMHLPHLRPYVQWVYGSTSPINVPDLQNKRMEITGAGMGGSGGREMNKVEETIVNRTGHLAPFEKVEECASVLASWITKHLRNYQADELFLQQHQSGKSERNKLVMSKEWLKGVLDKVDTKRPMKASL